MAITSANQCSSLSVWWQNTLASLELILPLLQDYPSKISFPEIQTYQNLVREAAYRVYESSVPSYANDLAEQLIVVLWHLNSSLKALDAADEPEAMSYFHLARVNWLVLQSNLEKHGIFVSNLLIHMEAAALPLLVETKDY